MIVFDALVVASAALRETSMPGQAFLHAKMSNILALSNAVDAEIERVLNRPRFTKTISAIRRAQILTALRNGATWFDQFEPIVDCSNVGNNKYLELALAAEVGEIITGDADLLALHPWRGVRILRPADYLLEASRGA